MIIRLVQIACDTCGDIHGDFPLVEGSENNWEPDRAALRFAEEDGWKVNRFARDVWYGNAKCYQCREIDGEVVDLDLNEIVDL